MTLEITQEIRRALSQSGGEFLRLVDAENNSAYVLVPVGVYDQIAHDQTAGQLRDTYAAQDAAAKAAGWDDPVMDEYNDYDAHKRQQTGP